MNINRDGRIICEACLSDNCEHVQAFGRLLGEKEDTQEALEVRDLVRRIETKKYKPPVSGTLLHVSDQGLVDLYRVSEYSDGSFLCTCPVCKTLKGISPTDAEIRIKKGEGVFETIRLHGCKHIKKVTAESGRAFREVYSYYPTTFQKVLLGMLCPPESVKTVAKIPLTTTQAYGIINALLKHHGIEFQEAVSAIRNGIPIPKFPFISVGIELEGGNVPHSQIKELIQAQGLYGYISDRYNSIDDAANRISNAEDLRRYGILAARLADDYCGINIGTDSSIHDIPHPFEVKSNRLSAIHGANSVAAFSNFLQALKDNGFKVNTSCGFHLHVGVSALTDSKQVGRAVVSYQELFLNSLKYLVHPSRLNNRYCQLYPRDSYQKLMSGRLSSVTLDRYRIINLQRYLSVFRNFANPYKSTIEYRIFNSTGGEKMGETVKSMTVFHAVLTDAMIFKQLITPDYVEKMKLTAKEVVENHADVVQFSENQREKIASALIFKQLLSELNFESSFKTWQEMGDTLKKRFIYYATLLEGNRFDEKLVGKLESTLYNDSDSLYLEFVNALTYATSEPVRRPRRVTVGR